MLHNGCLSFEWASNGHLNFTCIPPDMSTHGGEEAALQHLPFLQPVLYPPCAELSRLAVLQHAAWLPGLLATVSLPSPLLPSSLPHAPSSLPFPLLQLNLLSQCCLVYLFAPSVVHAYQVLRAEEVMWW